MAKYAGVSPGTVSNVLNHPNRVASTTLMKVEDAIENLGYIRNSSGRSLRSGRSNLAAMLLSGTGANGIIESSLGAEDEAAEFDLSLVLLSFPEDPRRQQRSLRTLVEQHIGGVLVSPASPSDTSSLWWLRQRDIKWVALTPSSSPLISGCFVSIDENAAGLEVGRHLLGHGHKRVVFLTGQAGRREPQLSGLRQAFREVGMAPDDAVRVIRLPRAVAQEGERAAVEVLESGASAVSCLNDELATGLVGGLYRRGASVPHHISVTGHGSSAVPGAGWLTSTSPPTYERGQVAMRLLPLELSESHHRHVQLRIPPKLLVGRSTSDLD